MALLKRRKLFKDLEKPFILGALYSNGITGQKWIN